MKKLFIIGLLLTATVVSQAQVAARSYKFLTSDVTSLAITNGINVTNLLTSGSLTTNLAGVSYTNSSGSKIWLTNSTKNFFQDVPLWALRDGSIPLITQTNGDARAQMSMAALSVTWATGSGANSANQIQFAPVYNGVHEAVAAAELWTIGLTATANSAKQTLVTNVPLWKWPGAVALRCRWAASNDADASSATHIIDLSLNGFVPTGP